LKLGICKLCLLEKPLCDSHLVPAALYKYCRAGENAPLRITVSEVGSTEEQVSTHLLCSKCENKLNRDGENWLVPKLATLGGSFPFYDLLVKEPPDYVQPDFIGYSCARNKHIGFRKLTNFLLGVFWKASVHSWRQSATRPLIDLGRYQEPLRLYLNRLQHSRNSATKAFPSILVSYSRNDNPPARRQAGPTGLADDVFRLESG
jgi:hypothetical protein